LVKRVFVATGTAIVVFAAKDATRTIYLFTVRIKIRKRVIEDHANILRDISRHGVAIDPKGI
jgi:hypothetical protein